MKRVALLRVLMYAAIRMGCPVWVNPESPDSSEWRHVRRWVEDYRHQHAAVNHEPTVVFDVSAAEEAEVCASWLLLFDA